MIEIEKKALISNEQYQILQEKFEFSNEKRQINFYYDNKEQIMISSGTTVRIRAKQEQMYLQVKKHIENTTEGTISTEFCQPIKSIPYVIDKKTLYNLTKMEYPEVYLLGFLATDRLIYYVDSKIELVIDKNYYLGELDYELEIEYTCEFERVYFLIKELEEIGIQFQNNPISKSRRFITKYYT